MSKKSKTPTKELMQWQRDELKKVNEAIAFWEYFKPDEPFLKSFKYYCVQIRNYGRRLHEI